VVDNAIIRSAIELQLRGLGLTAESLEDASAAEALLTTGAPFDLVLVDERLGVGAARIQRLAADPQRRSGVILLKDAIGRGARDGAENVAATLVRPVRVAALTHAIERALGLGMPAAEASSPTRGTCTIAGTSVLVAEDNPVNQVVARTQLERLGCQVTVAANGREALAAVERGGFDLVLMDCQMPEMDGFEATRALRAHGCRLPIIALTANGLAEDRERCLAAGMDDYVTKPVTATTLRTALERWTRERARPDVVADGPGAA
jgi:CheY-like chemotaxis protein